MGLPRYIFFSIIAVVVIILITVISIFISPSKKGNQISEKPTNTIPELPKPDLLPDTDEMTKMPTKPRPTPRILPSPRISPTLTRPKSSNDDTFLIPGYKFVRVRNPCFCQFFIN